MNSLTRSVAAISEETYYRLQERRMLLAEATRLVNDHLYFDVRESMRLVIRVLEQVQLSDERVVDLHRECLGMIESVQKLMRIYDSAKPIIIKLDAEGDGDEHF